eukprot:scaffold718_cov342-Pavlova_lutheri.AAC.4
MSLQRDGPATCHGIQEKMSSSDVGEPAEAVGYARSEGSGGQGTAIPAGHRVQLTPVRVPARFPGVHLPSFRWFGGCRARCFWICARVAHSAFGGRNAGTLSFRVPVGDPRIDRTVGDGVVGTPLCVEQGQRHDHLLIPHPHLDFQIELGCGLDGGPPVLFGRLVRPLARHPERGGRCACDPDAGRAASCSWTFGARIVRPWLLLFFCQPPVVRRSAAVRARRVLPLARAWILHRIDLRRSFRPVSMDVQRSVPFLGRRGSCDGVESFVGSDADLFVFAHVRVDVVRGFPIHHGSSHLLSMDGIACHAQSSR